LTRSRGTFAAVVSTAIFVVSAFLFCLPMMAQEQCGWHFDSLRANSSVSTPDVQQAYDVLLKMLDRWNAHDIEGHLEVYWKSAELLVVLDSERFNGWQQLQDSYISGYPDRNSMEFIRMRLTNFTYHFAAEFVEVGG
jgi:hypothetical protein